MEKNKWFNESIYTSHRGGSNYSSTGLKIFLSPIIAKRQKEMENKEYFDPLKKYAQISEDEGNHIERNPLIIIY